MKQPVAPSALSYYPSLPSSRIFAAALRAFFHVPPSDGQSFSYAAVPSFWTTRSTFSFHAFFIPWYTSHTLSTSILRNANIWPYSSISRYSSECTNQCRILANFYCNFRSFSGTSGISSGKAFFKQISWSNPSYTLQNIWRQLRVSKYLWLWESGSERQLWVNVVITQESNVRRRCWHICVNFGASQSVHPVFQSLVLLSLSLFGILFPDVLQI